MLGDQRLFSVHSLAASTPNGIALFQTERSASDDDDDWKQCLQM